MQPVMDNTIKALKTAIQMEVDGKEFYLKAAQASRNNLGKKLLNQLAAEEDIHRQVFENIYNSLGKNEGWPEVHIKPDSSLKTILSGARNEIAGDTSVIKEEIDAVETAMGLENKTFDYYRGQAKSAGLSQEKQFYEALASQEEEHHRVLLSYYEFLKDPEAWFVQAEHPSLDGG